MTRLPYTAQDFAWALWGPEEIRTHADKALTDKKEMYTQIKNVPASERTFLNTIYALEASDHTISNLAGIFELLKSVSPDEQVRDTAKDNLTKLQQKLVDIEYDEDIYRAVKEYPEKNENLIGPDKKLFEDMLRGYRRMGFELASEKREELKKILKEMSDLENAFQKNTDDWEDHILVTRDELEGLPDFYIANLAKADDVHFKVTLEYPDSVPFMEHAKNAAKRKELSDKRNQKGGQENMAILAKLLKLRDQHAHLLGYENHIAFQTEERMAKNEKNVLDFIHGLTAKLHNGVKDDLAKLQALKKAETHTDEPVQYYDVAYYGEKLLHDTLQLDSNKVREYFPFALVKKGVLDIYQTLLSLKFLKLEDIQFWHEDVECYQVNDLHNNLIGYFLMDLYPRPKKYGHAAAFSVLHGRAKEHGSDQYITPISCMVTNFPKPSQDNPSLMSHDEVVTFLHEFGHIMHGVLTLAPYASQSGTNVTHDYVEAPSQMLENWGWNREILGMLSGHYQNQDQKLPDDMIESLVKAKQHMIAYDTMRQMVFALFDMTIHHGIPTQSTADIYNALVQKYMGITLNPHNIFPASFGHLAGGYDAGYYGYMWSKVYSADMFSRFKKEGLLNPETGRAYREWILEKGSSIEESDILRGFLGREPNNQAFLEDIGLA